MTRHGCLGFGLFALLGPAHGAAEPVTVQTRTFDVEYAINPEAAPLQSVVLWYTADRSASWQQAGADTDRRSPIRFEAPADGLFGLYLIAANATGPSSATPSEQTTPHLRVFVDATPPVVQLHPLKLERTAGERSVQIRWTAIDDHFGARPIEIAYQRPPDDAWQAVSPDPLPNTGRYDWRVSDGLRGPVTVRVTARDHGGHVVHSEPRTLELADAAPADNGALTRSAAPVTGGSRAIPVGYDDTALPGSARARARASRLQQQAAALLDTGKHRRAASLLRDAVRLDPHNPSLFAALGEALYRVGDFDRALEAYELALRREPTLRAALRGSAMVLRQKKDLGAAAERLRTILRYNPGDAEVWMNLGDVAIFQGDEVLARECYTRAAQIDPEATNVIAEARQRLKLMEEVSRRYESGGR